METLRTVLSHLSTPHRLDTPQIRQLLAHHRRLPPSLSPTAVGAAAARLLTDTIAALEPPPDAPAPQRLPYEVLATCFLRGRKNFQAAAELGLSERQLTRERERALRLLAAELAVPPAPALARTPIPSIEGHVKRPDLLRRLSEAASVDRLVAVTGDAGAGKTSLVAALAHALGPEHVWWHRIRPGVSDTLQALLVELCEPLAREGSPVLRDYLATQCAGVDVATAARLALQGLAGKPRLLVVDDFGSASDPKSIESWLEEVVDRLPLVSVVTIGAGTPTAVALEVPPLTRAETASLFRLRGLSCAGHVVDAVHGLSHGNAGILDAIARWWSADARGLDVLDRRLRARPALQNLADLAAYTHRGAA